MRAGLVALLLLPACLDAVLEAPYVVTTQLGASRSVAPSGRDTVLVGTDQGLWEIEPTGGQAKLSDLPVRALTAHPDAIYLLSGDAIAWGPLPPVGGTFAPKATQPAKGVVDLQAWCGSEVLLADPRGVTAWDRDTGETYAWATGLHDVRAVALGSSCDEALVVTADAVLAASPTGPRVLVEGLVQARAAAQDNQGRLWVVSGQTPVLNRVDGAVSGQGKLLEFAKYLGDPRDLQIGVGGRWPTQNLYIADGDGRLSYVRLP